MQAYETVLCGHVESYAGLFDLEFVWRVQRVCCRVGGIEEVSLGERGNACMELGDAEKNSSTDLRDQ